MPSKSSTIPQLQLPSLTPLEPLTSGTSLPVPAEDLTPTDSNPSLSAPRPPPTPTSATTPPQSPGRPTSMRRFLSRVSLNSTYNDDDKASVLSTPMSPTGSTMSTGEGKRKTSGSFKKPSWWKKNKSTVAPVHENGSIREGDIVVAPVTKRKQSVQSVAPPPQLPDDMFGTGFGSLDSDMFKNFK